MNRGNRWGRGNYRHNAGGGQGPYRNAHAGRSGTGTGGESSEDRSRHEGNTTGDNQPSNEGRRHPSHLKGKEIGMFYARKQEKEKVERDKLESIPIPIVEINSQFSSYLQSLLQKLEQKPENTASGSTLLEDVNRSNSNHGLSEQGFLSSEISRNPEVDEKLHRELSELSRSNPQYQNMFRFRENLPAYKCKDEILSSIAKNQVVVISGETGCGKTTQIGQYILDDMILQRNGSCCNILCTQPRRISAVTVAERVAAERCELVGSKSVGYVIRLESKPPRRRTEGGGAVTFCTTGIVFQYLRDDPYLKQYSHIIVDEVHERDCNSDILIAVLKDLIKIRPELKVILMSATLNADHFSRYFQNCPTFSIPGMTFPVTEYFLEDILEKLNYRFTSPFPEYKRSRWRRDEMEYEKHLNRYTKRMASKYSQSTLNEILRPESENFDCLVELTVSLLDEISKLDKELGAVLIFVTGWGEISKLNKRLESCGRFPESKFLILPLHSMLPTVNQKQIFERPPFGKRKIIIATNIAETSITIDDVIHVIDFGKINMTNFDLNRNVQSLDSEWVSRANASQRRGRAGRVQAGYCYHLFSSSRESTFDDYKKPEIKRKRLEEVILQLKILKLGDIRSIFNRLLDPPSRKAVDLSFERLILIHALDNEENITPLGYHLAHLPMDPHTGKMILMGAIFSCIDPVSSVAAALSFKDPFHMPLGKEDQVDKIRKNFSQGTKSDHWAIVKSIEGFEDACHARYEKDYCFRNFLSLSTCNMLLNFKKQFCEQLHGMRFLASSNCQHFESNRNSSNIALVKAIICSGLYPNIARIKPRIRAGGPPFPQLSTPEDGKVVIHRSSVNTREVNFECPFVMYHQKQKTKDVNLFDTTMISPYPLIFFGGKLHFSVDHKTPTVSVDGNFNFQVSRVHFQIVQALRQNMLKLCARKIQNPAPTNWNSDSIEGELLIAIRDLITSQYDCIINPQQAYSHSQFEEDEDD